MTRYLICVLLGALLPGLVAGQTPEARIEAARTQVAQAGLPVSILDDRIAEGRAKGITSERIAEAVERRALALAAAGTALRPTVSQVSPAELVRGAEAIEAGIPAEALRQVVAGARAEDRPVALAVLTFLHRDQGLPLENALARVAEAMARGPDALRDLPARASAEATRGSSRPDRNTPPQGAAPSARPGNRPDGVGRPEGAGPPADRPPPRPGRS